jgi:hypothetical protein
MKLFVWHEKNIQILREHYADDVISLALAFVNKSWGLWKTGRLEEAERSLERVLETVVGVDGKDFQACRAYV